MSGTNPNSTPSLSCRVITLNPESENSKKLIGDLNAQGIDATFYQAVDGRQSTPELLADEYLDKNYALIRHQRQLTNGEIGCYLSHLRAIREAYQLGYEYLCLIEDDVVIEPDFGLVVSTLLNQSLEFVRLMALKIRPRKIIRKIITDHLITRPSRGTLGTQAYLINRRGMEKILRHARRIYEPIDHVYDHFFLFGMQCYQIEPHVAYELDRTTTVAKKATDSTVTPSLWQQLQHHPAKLWFSIRRHSFTLMNYRDFHPAKWPVNRPGKSTRMRGKGKGKQLLSEVRSNDN